MAGFQFKLQAVLTQRCRHEDECQRDLAKGLRQRMILENQLRHMQQTIRDSKQQLTGGLRGQVDLPQVSQFARYSGQVTQRAHGMVVKLAGLEKQIAGARERLIEATRARRALELLRDKQFRHWQREQDRREAARLDEIAVQAYARNVMGATG